eukprot:4438078-Alexandrium_andersonii.AAC.1
MRVVPRKHPAAHVITYVAFATYAARRAGHATWSLDRSLASTAAQPSAIHRTSGAEIRVAFPVA